MSSEDFYPIFGFLKTFQKTENNQALANIERTFPETCNSSKSGRLEESGKNSINIHRKSQKPLIRLKVFMHI